ncbi:MAG: hypothetical protein RI964_203 [Pseudomonadota bacterium]|jgi:drug/metabolite transporter (DMT)-like permease
MLNPRWSHAVALSCILYSAILWGLFWYPFRLLDEQGMDGLTATCLAYTLPLLVVGSWYAKDVWQARQHTLWLVILGLASGWSNVGYVLGVLNGEVMRVLLLFYLSPLWTVLLARVLLGERLTVLGWWVIALSLGGAVVMLWQPQSGIPLPANRAEWLGLSAGVTFALSVVVGRRLGEQANDGVKTVTVWLGVAIFTAIGLLFYPPLHSFADYSATTWWWLLGLAVGIGTVTYAVQYGVARISASQSSVIFLFELIIAAIAAYFLTQERMALQEWLGAGMILVASLFSGKMQHD